MAETLWDAITRRATDFIEGGQERRQWLDDLGRKAEYYVPPELRDRIGLLSKALEFTDAGDMIAAEEASRDLWNNPSVGSAANYAAAGLGLALPVVSSRMMQEGVDVAGDAISSLADDARSIWSRLNQPGPVPTMYSNPVGRAAGDAPTGIRAFHGSPHEFERFDFSKMGTGEGAQAYGRGGYFASEADVARGYRRRLENATVNGQPVYKLYDSISSRADRLPPKAAEAEYNKMAVLEDLMNDGDVLAVRERASSGAYDQDAMDWFEKEIAPNFKGSGSLYEVNIRANPDDFLDWDKPLSEQPKSVLDALDPFIQERLASVTAAGERGRQIAKEKGLPDFAPKSREQILAKMRGGDIAASGRLGQSSFSEDALREAGVPGIKYLDPQDGSQNYVVFDENLIDIVRKYGIAGAALMLGMSQADLAQAMQAQQQQQPQGLLGGPQ